MKTRSTLELIILSFILIISFSSCSKDDSSSSGGSSGDSSFTIKETGLPHVVKTGSRYHPLVEIKEVSP